MAKNAKSNEDDIQVTLVPEETTEVTDDPDREEAETTVPEAPEGLDVKARQLMADKKVKSVWYCPKRGYWFVNKDLAFAYAKSHNVTLKTFEK